MFGSTMLLTVGQALDRAQHEGLTIRLQISGDWITGRVTNTDAQSLVLISEDGTTYVMRMDAITAVALPLEEPAPAEDRNLVPQQASFEGRG